MSAEHKAGKEKLWHAINRNKSYWWKTLYKDIVRNQWAMGYEIVTQDLRGRETPSTFNAAVMRNIVRVVFPRHLELEQIDIC